MTFPKTEIRAEAERLRARFVAAGARAVETDVLLPAAALLDLYGEDIRTRAYLTPDPTGGEAVLRPDFTVPVTQAHMASKAGPARYAYAGEVFRRQEHAPDRAREYLQAGYERFDSVGDMGAGTPEAETFALFAEILAPLGVRGTVGDIGLLSAAVEGLSASPQRKAALRRHLWRPRRFRALLDRYAGRRETPPARAAVLAADDPFAGLGEVFGRRTRAEIAARIEALRADAAEAPIPAAEVEAVMAVLSLSAPAPAALDRVRGLVSALPAMERAAARLARRLDAMAALGIDVGSLGFEGSLGRTTMEYYDGFVFAFVAPDRPDWPPVATGGRYDALAARLGGADLAGVGGIIRPGLTLELAR